MSKAKITPQNIKGYLQGNFRKFAETLNIPNIMPDHIQEQIHWRLSIMSEECIKNGKCPCECSVPAKQYEDRPCENFCYPPMMDIKKWNYFKSVSNLTTEKIEEDLLKRKHLFVDEHN